MNLPATHDPKLAIGEAIYSPAARALVVADQEQRLEPRLADLLEAFCARPGEVIGRDTLLDEVWGDEGSDEALTQAISRLRQMLGETQPLASKPGSIRGDFSIDLGRNICHGSDSPESAAHELKMWFPEGVNDWGKTVDAHVYES